MKKYSVFHALVMSFFSKSLYQDVGRNWRGICFFYLLLVTLICWIPFAFLGVDALKLTVKNLGPMIQQLPLITIKGGELSIDKPSPYIINSEDNAKPFVIFDTSGQYTSLENTEAAVLVTKTTVFVRKNAEEIRQYDLSKISNFSFGPENAQNLVKKAIDWGVLVIGIVIVLCAFIYHLIQILLYGVVGIIFASIMGRELSFAALMRLSAVAITPTLFLSTVLSLINTNMPADLLVYFLLELIYLFAAIKSNPRKGSVILDMQK